MDIQWETDLRDLPDIFADTRKGSDPTALSSTCHCESLRELNRKGMWMVYRRVGRIWERRLQQLVVFGQRELDISEELWRVGFIV